MMPSGHTGKDTKYGFQFDGNKASLITQSPIWLFREGRKEVGLVTLLESQLNIN